MFEISNTSIKIPEELFERIESRVKGTEFDDVSEYVTYILRKILSEMESRETKPQNDQISKEDEMKIKDKLKDLGYLD